MADSKLSALTELAVEPAGSDEFYLNDGGTSKRITYANLKVELQALVNDTTPQLGGDLDVNGKEITSSANIVLELGDAAGAQKFSIQDSGDVEIFSVDSDGHIDGIHMELNRTASFNDDHALELIVDANGFGDVKALDINYDTGAIVTGEDEAVILISINELDALGGEVFGVEVLSTDGAADAIYGIKAGAVVGPILQDSGVFANPTTGTNNTTSTDIADMIDGSTGTNTTLWVNDNDYILIGAAAAFTEIEFIIETGAGNPGIQPTFGYSISGAHQFTTFSPVDGTDGFRNTGVVAWDANDLSSHTTNDDTGTFDIKITRTHNAQGSVSLFYAKTAATVVYSWDKDGVVTVKEAHIAAVETNTDTGGSVNPFSIQQTYNQQSGDAANTDFLINRIETAVGSGVQLLFDAQVGSTTKFNIDNTGDVAFSSSDWSLRGPDPDFRIRMVTNVFYFYDETSKIILAVKNVSGGDPGGFVALDDEGFYAISTGNASGSAHTRLYSDVSYEWEMRNKDNPFTLQIYADQDSTTDYQRTSIRTSRTATTVPSASSFTLSNFIPDGAFLIGITTRVDTTCTTATGYTVGDGSDVDLWGVVATVSAGTASGSADFTAAGASGTLYTSAQDVVITSSGGNFDGTGVITVCAHYLITEAD